MPSVRGGEGSLEEGGEGATLPLRFPAGDARPRPPPGARFSPPSSACAPAGYPDDPLKQRLSRKMPTESSRGSLKSEEYYLHSFSHPLKP
eukprot:423815-Prorocentrum_minimum.AAC.1